MNHRFAHPPWLVALLVLPGSSLPAATHYWDGGGNNWQWLDGTNWYASTGDNTVPDSGDPVYIGHADSSPPPPNVPTASVTLDGQGYCSSLHLGDNNGGNGSLAVTSSGTLNTSGNTGSIYVGNSIGSTGTLTVQGGTIHASQLYIGAGSANCYGTLAIQSGQVNADDVHLGDVSNTVNGSRVVQSGGTFTIRDGHDIWMGHDQSDSRGYYEMSGSGSLSTPNLYVGYRGEGNFTQTGGTVTIRGSGGLYLGSNNNISNPGGGTGAYTLSGGNLAVGGDIGEINGTGTSTFTINGFTSFTYGSNIKVDTLNLAKAAGSNVNFSIGSGKTIQAATQTIGDQGTASVIQTGGYNGQWQGYAGTLYMAYTSGSASYQLQGGTMTYYHEYLGRGGNALYQQSDGTHNCQSAMEVGYGASATYSISGGTLNCPDVNIGKNGSAGRFEWFCDPAASHVVGSLDLGGAGTLAMGYSFSVDSLAGGVYCGISGLNLATLEVTNGATATHTGNWTIPTLRVGSSTGAGTYQFSGSGGATTLAVGNATGTGTLNISGGTAAVTNLTLGNDSATGTVRLTGGALAVTNAIPNGSGSGILILDGGSFLPGGNVNVDAWKVGENATASFHQSGGTYEIQGNLTLGVNATADGTYKLSTGGVLNVSGAVVTGSGTGTLILNGGTLNASGTVTVSNLKLADTTDVSFTQTSNTWTAGALLLGMNPGRNGSWRLDGGTLNVGAIPDSPGTSALILNGGSLAAGGDIHVDSLTVGLTRAVNHEQTAHGVSVSGSMVLGTGSGYKLSGGSLDVTGAINGGNGTLNLNGGTLVAHGNVTVGQLVVGDNQTGSHTQSGQTWSAGTSMTLGQNTGGSGLYQLSGGSLNIKGPLTIGASGTGRFVWQGGTLTATAMNFGTGSGLAMGFGISIDSLADGSLYGGSQGPGHLERASLDLSGGTSTHLAADVALASVRIAAGTAASYFLQGGSLAVDRLEVGASPAGKGTFTQSGGSVNVANTIQVGSMPAASGTYQLRGGTLGGSASLVVRPFGGPGDALFTGNGTVGLTGTLTNNGRVVADGFGTSRDLDLTAAAGVRNSLENMVGERHGWGAEDGGRLILPAIAVDASRVLYNWGETPVEQGEPTIDLVNSVQFTLHGLAGDGELTGQLLAVDHTAVPALPAGATVIGVWDFVLTADFASARLTFRYDDILARELGVQDENLLEVLHYEGGQWQVVTADRNLAAKWITTGDLTSLSPFAVAVIPEPGAVALLVFGASVLWWRGARDRHTAHRR